MKKKFLNEDFLLQSDYAKELYHNYASKMPIFDWHCHLEAKEIYEDKNLGTITNARLSGDHYKWRVMRAVGIDEKYITGDADDYEKFKAYAKTMPNLIGNPIYHRTHLELKNYFGIDYVLDESTAKEIYDIANEKLALREFSPRGLIKMSNVTAICTTNDPIDDLKYHDLLEEDDTFDVSISPAFRPDNALSIEKDSFISYLEDLSFVSDVEVKDYESLKEALYKRMNFFEVRGCKASDQAFKYIPYIKEDDSKIDEIFRKKINGEKLTTREEDAYKTSLLIYLAGEYYKRDWAMEIHVGVIRDNSKKLFEELGADSGGDATNDEPYAENLAHLLSDIEDNGMPKLIVFPLNPAEFYPVTTIAGSFNRGNEDASLTAQLGPSWWHLDHKNGMIEHMEILSATSAFSKFIGMTTDSRSFLSYPRHEYFRRLLCNFIGNIVEDGEYPWDKDLLGQMVEDICYNNARNIIKVEF